MSPEPLFEREIKLRYDSVEAARAAVAKLGATLWRPRRLQDDVLLDGDAGSLQHRRCALRVRRDGDRIAVVTWKGPPIASTMKLREETETTVASADMMLRIFDELGFRPRFRYQKYRTELVLPDVVVAIDETPIGVFVELEGEEAAITDVATRLGRAPDDYVRASYRTLFLESRETQGPATGQRAEREMVFDPS